MAPLLALAAVLAALVQRWRCSVGPAATAEAIALLGAGALAAVGLLSTALAVVGWFSGPSFTIIAVALAVLIWPWGQQPALRPAAPLPRRTRALRAAGLVALLAGAAALRWPPIPADLGGRDQGTYALRARHTLRTGRIDHTDPVLARAGAEVRHRPGPGDILGLYHADTSPARIGRYEGAYRPGFYLARRDEGAVVPQFLHLHPSLMALFGLVFGTWAIGLVAPLAGLLATLALWALADRLWPRAPWPWLAASLFALSPIAVWTHRTPLTEPLTGLLLLSAALAAARGLAGGAPAQLLAAALLGCAGFVRGNLWLAAPAVLAVLWLRPEPGRTRMSAPGLLAGLLLASLALHLATCWPYLYDEFRRQLGPLAALSPTGAFALLAAALAAYAAIDALLARSHMSAETGPQGRPAARAHLSAATGPHSRATVRDDLSAATGPQGQEQPFPRGQPTIRDSLTIATGPQGQLPPLARITAALPAALAVLAALAVTVYLVLRAPGPPWSRLDPALPLLGAPLLLAAAAGLLVFARLRPRPGAAAVWLLALASLPVTSLALYAQRNLPQLGLYYYGRYLVPELLPAACLLAALALANVHRYLSERTGLGRHARWVTLLLALALLFAQAFPYLRAPVTRLQEFAGADRLIDDLAAELPEDAVVIAGGEGWHAAHTFNQLGGALAFGHGRTILPYRGREATYAALHELLIAGPTARSEPPPPVFLLLNEATHPLRPPGSDAPLAVADDLLPPPFVARPVALAELVTDRLTPVEDSIPTRVTRADLRVALFAVTVDPARRADVRTWRLVDGVAAGPGPVTLSGYTLRDGHVCLDGEHPLTLTLPPGGAGETSPKSAGEPVLEGPGSLVLVGVPGASVHAWRVAIDGVPFPLDPPHTSPPRARDTAGPLPFAASPQRLEIWGDPRARPEQPCPHGGLAELRLLGPDRGGPREPTWTRTYTPPHDLGHRVTPARWIYGRALSRARPGVAPADEIDGPSVVVRPGAPLTFPIEHVPADSELDVAVTVRARRLAPTARLRITANGQPIAELDPPDDGDAAWQSVPVRWRPAGAAVRFAVELVGAPDDHAAVRDVIVTTPPASD